MKRILLYVFLLISLTTLGQTRAEILSYAGGSGNLSNGQLTTPETPTVTNITESGATFSWGSVGNATAYVAEMALYGTSNFTQIYNSSGTSVTVSGLTAFTHYQWRVKALGTNYDPSSYAFADATTLAANSTTPFYMIIGQSNTGWQSMGDLGVEKPTYDIDLNAKIFNIPATTWRTYHPGDLTGANDYTPADGKGFGLGANFVKMLNEDNPNKEVWLFQEGHGGSSLAANPGNQNLDWSPTTGLYGNLTNGSVWQNFNTAIAAATAAGKILDFKGVILMQGETDAGTQAFADAYASNLATFFSNLDTKLTSIFAANSQTLGAYKKYICRISAPLQTYRTTVRTAQENYCANASNNAVLINTDDIPLLTDNLHYTAPGAILLGARIFYVDKGIKQPTSYDVAAQAIFAANTSITDTLERIAINQYILDEKAAGIWAKWAVNYAPVFGAATGVSHGINFKNPGTNDLTYSGTVTHYSNGMASGGGYALTGLNATSLSSANSVSLSTWNGTSGVNSGHNLGVSDGTNAILMHTHAADGLSYFYINEAKSPDIGSALGMNTISRTANNATSIFLNITKVGGSTTTATGALPNLTFYLMGTNSSGAAANISNNTGKFYGIGSGLTDTEIKVHNKAVERMLITANKL